MSLIAIQWDAITLAHFYAPTSLTVSSGSETGQRGTFCNPLIHLLIDVETLDQFW